MSRSAARSAEPAASPARTGDVGELVILLHSHMPYVEGFGTWPFGEEWLWEAVATSYLPLLKLLRAGAPITLSLTPVLADQLEAPGAVGRCLRFLRGVRCETHGLDRASARRAGDARLDAALAHSEALYEHSADLLEALSGNLIGALAPHVAWTSSATHAVLPLVATEAGVSLQVAGGIAAHRARFEEEWRGGFWLPECAYAPWLDAPLAELGVHATCVDLTDVLGWGSPEHLRPLRSSDGPLLVPVDREVVDLVWHSKGYPAQAAYRDSFRRTAHDHNGHANHGGPYDPRAAAHQARRDARDFVDRVLSRLSAGAQDLGRRVLCVCALDTELLGHWWHEGPDWLEAVLDEAAARGLAVTRLDDALSRHAAEPAPGTGLPVTSWGRPRTLATWSGPGVAELAFAARDAELRTLRGRARPGARALRELLALQSSDWAFMVSGRVAEPYGRRRAAEHLAELDRALAGIDCGAPALRNLAPHLDAGPVV